MLRLFYLLLLGGCVSNLPILPHNIEVEKKEVDWVKVFIRELNIAIENNDPEARYFFSQELIKEEYKRKYGKELHPNPRLIHFYN